MIVQRATLLMDLCEQYRQLRQAREKREKFEELRDGLKEVLDDRKEGLFQRFTSAVTLREAQIGNLPQSAFASNLRGQSTEALNKFRIRHDALLGEGEFPLRAFARDARTLAGQCDQELVALWDVEFERQIPRVPMALVDLYRQRPGLTEKANRISRLLMLVESYRSVPPRDAQALQNFRENIAELKLAWKSLVDSGGEGDAEIPPDIMDFIEAASAPGGAALALATPRVIAWLAKQGLDMRFVVRTSNPRSA